MDALTQLVHELGKLPGIGEKSATRLSYHLLDQSEETINSLANSLMRAKKHIQLCDNCFTFTENSKCSICESGSREREIICVVERPSDVTAIEMSASFGGSYHVLHGLLSPVEGIGPDELKAKELLARLRVLNDDNLNVELVLALNPSVEGEATSLYLNKILKPLVHKISKIAYGLPMGGSIEYADRQTLGKVISNRVEF